MVRRGSRGEERGEVLRREESECKQRGGDTEIKKNHDH